MSKPTIPEWKDDVVRFRTIRSKRRVHRVVIFKDERGNPCKIGLERLRAMHKASEGLPLERICDLRALYFNWHGDSIKHVSRYVHYAQKEGKRLAFISSPYASWSGQNYLAMARAMCYVAMQDGYAPFASHLIYTQYLDDENADHRKLGIEMGRQFMPFCERMYVLDVERPTAGMNGDIDHHLWCNDRFGLDIELKYVKMRDLLPIIQTLHTPAWITGDNK